jgi:ammonia channel protein AmtB
MKNMEENKNIFLSEPVQSKVNFSDTTWILVSTVLVFVMIPGLGFFYGGLAQRKNQLSLLITCAFSIAIVSIQVNQIKSSK